METFDVACAPCAVKMTAFRLYTELPLFCVISRFQLVFEANRFCSSGRAFDSQSVTAPNFADETVFAYFAITPRS